MIYLALGDSISIDKYTGVDGGGAASQFALLLNTADFTNLTLDGSTTKDVLDAIEGYSGPPPDVVTLTVCGNDLMEFALKLRNPHADVNASVFEFALDTIVRNFRTLCKCINEYHCTVIINTIYDPTDGDDDLAEMMGMSKAWRSVYECINKDIEAAALEEGYILCDLQSLFRGHGAISAKPWIVKHIEPNLSGATAIANNWLALLRKAQSL